MGNIIYVFIMSRKLVFISNPYMINNPMLLLNHLVQVVITMMTHIMMKEQYKKGNQSKPQVNTTAIFSIQPTVVMVMTIAITTVAMMMMIVMMETHVLSVLNHS